MLSCYHIDIKENTGLPGIVSLQWSASMTFMAVLMPEIQFTPGVITYSGQNLQSTVLHSLEYLVPPNKHFQSKWSWSNPTIIPSQTAFPCWKFSSKLHELLISANILIIWKPISPHVSCVYF
jgi:hypothetical protein